VNNRIEAVSHYQHAWKSGKKAHNQSVQQGKDPFIEVLDDLLAENTAAGEVNIGLLEIPMERIVGTKTQARSNAFAANFMPLLPADSEFGQKWCKLCEVHLSDEGIRNPILCYEYLGKFYVVEGNKRVSVLKYFGAESITGNVVRILPGESDAHDVQLYKEFLEYYPLIKLYRLAFTRAGSFPKLQVALGYEPDHVWSDEERRDFLSGYIAFKAVFDKMGGEQLNAAAADALLEWLKVYSFTELTELPETALRHSLESIWPEIRAIGQPDIIEVNTETDCCEDSSFINRLMHSVMPSHLKVAFVHELTVENSIWVRSHEVGRQYLEEVMGDQVTVQTFTGVGSGEEAEQAMETAIENGAEVIFATTAPLIAACRKVAVRHPETKILNCSISMPYTDIRTYYSRIYEGKFISGAIAGAISRSDDIGYIANYPIFGVPAGINAFALGAQLTNPNARIHVRWSCVNGDPVRELTEFGVDVVSTLDSPMPGWSEGQWGAFRMLPDGRTELIASPYWNWGTFYVQFARSFLSKSLDAGLFGRSEGRAVNYWWGMSSGVIDVELSDSIPAGTKALAEFLKQGIINGSIDPFLRRLVSQDGVVRSEGEAALSPEAILNMDWLCDNVVGSIPEYEQLTEKAKSLVRLQGVYRDRIPLQKESVLL